MIDRFTAMRTRDISLDCQKDLGELNLNRHWTGIGGVFPMPMPRPVAEGIKKLGFPMIRVFLQEFFDILKEDGSLDWSKLDPYMEAACETGAVIMASVCLKPRALYPIVDETIFMPNDIHKWQRLIRELVKRYSVEKRYVTHWSVGNETNIGEWGGCPYRITSPDDFFEYYRMTVAPILEVMPDAKVGGPSFAGVQGAAEYIAGFAALCKARHVPLDFVSYNMYSDDPVSWAESAAEIKAAVAKIDQTIGLYVTELNIGIGNEVSVEEKAYDPKRAAGLAAILLALHESGSVDGTFQYHAYDQYCDPRLFAPFYARTRYMAEHWNDIPHRLGLFDQNGTPRPQFFVYDMIRKLAPRRFAADVKDDDVRLVASRDGDNRITILAAHYAAAGASDAVWRFSFRDMPAGLYRMTVTRIDHEFKRNGLELIPSEDRRLYAHPDFHFNVYAPADSLVLIEFSKEA